MDKKQKLPIALIIICMVLTVSILMFKCNLSNRGGASRSRETNSELGGNVPKFMFGICVDSLDVLTDDVKRGDTFGGLLEKQGVTSAEVHSIVLMSEGVFDLKTFRHGNKYNVFKDKNNKLQYFIYEHTVKEYIVIDFTRGLTLKKCEKDVVLERKYAEAEISSSLWVAIVDQGLNPALAAMLSDVFQWSIDFYAMQKGDKFKVVYDEMFIDGESIGIGTIWGSIFSHSDKEYYAVRYEYMDKGQKVKGYWDEEGKSLKSAFLKAPLSYSRISSTFSNSRLHPVLRIRRPHHGVDYAAPSGTPVQAIGDGVVTFCQYSGGGGNTIKIKHARGYVSGYLHLRGYAKGIRVGTRVSQGDLIGYVGSTGLSTGPHLDFRIWKNGTAIDPLKMSNEKGEDITSSQKESYNLVKDKVISEVSTGIPDEGMAFASDSLKMRLVTVPIK
ncbi:MAG: peptidoglycan DD-metalloendopeptidase family protein [Rikenellaceae bacterium]